MHTTRRTMIAGAAALAASSARAQQPGITPGIEPGIKIGVLADFSGIYVDLMGPGGVACVQQAVRDFAPGFPVQVVYGDHQNKADVGSNIVRNWYDAEGVDMVIGLPNSPTALAAAVVTRERDKVCIGAAVTTMEFTGAQCTPNSINWTYDAYMLAKATGVQTVAAGGKRWYFITVDNSFGASLQGEMAGFVTGAGGTVLGNSKYPIGATDYSSLLLAAQASGADVLCLALGGTDMVNSLKQAGEFGLRRTMRIAAPVTLINDIHALGLPVAQGLLHTNSFYWDTNDRTRAFTRRVLPMMRGAYPGMAQAGCYAGALHYLKAVASMGVPAAKASGAATVARMKAMPADDDAFGPVTIRADGRALVPAFLLRVKTPEESHGPWDYCTIVAELAGPDAAKPLDQGGCPLVRA